MGKPSPLLRLRATRVSFCHGEDREEDKQGTSEVQPPGKAGGAVKTV